MEVPPCRKCEVEVLLSFLKADPVKNDVPHNVIILITGMFFERFHNTLNVSVEQLNTDSTGLTVLREIQYNPRICW